MQVLLQWYSTCQWEESNWTPRLMNQVTCDCKKVLGPSCHSAELLPTLLWAMLKITAFVWRCLKIWHPLTNLKQLNTGKQLNRNTGRTLLSLPKSVQKTWLSSVSIYCKHVNIAKLSSSASLRHAHTAWAWPSPSSGSEAQSCTAFPIFFLPQRNAGKKKQFAESIVCGCVYRCL